MAGNSVTGRKLLIVEDDFLISLDLAEALGHLGAVVLGPVGNVDDALDLLAQTPVVDGAVLDLNLGDEMSYPIADKLSAMGVPFAFTTGYDRSYIDPRFSKVTRLEKPVAISDVVQALFG